MKDPQIEEEIVTEYLTDALYHLHIIGGILEPHKENKVIEQVLMELDDAILYIKMARGKYE